EVIASFDPQFTPPDAAIVRATRANSAAVRGEPALPVLRLGATDARFFRAAGIPTVVFGPKAYNMGGPHEYVTLDDLQTVARVQAGVVVDFFYDRCGRRTKAEGRNSALPSSFVGGTKWRHPQASRRPPSRSPA